MGELDDFVQAVLDVHLGAVDAFHSGDTTLWRRLWADHEPVSLFGPGRPPAVGAARTVSTFEGVAARMANGSGACLEVLHAEVSGNLGLIAGLERAVLSIEGAPVSPQTLRVTMIYRREHEVWRLVHRHADALPA